MRIMDKLRKRLRHTVARDLVVAYRHLGLRPGDVFLASYPKSGNTWLRHMIASVMGEKSHDWRGGIAHVGLQVGEHRDLPEVLRNRGRIIKTHEPYRSSYGQAVYLVRDGRDVAVSEYHFRKRYRPRSIDTRSFAGFLSQFLVGHSNGYGAWSEHVLSWLRSPVAQQGSFCLVRYEDLKSRTHVELARVCDFLGLEFDGPQIDRAVAENTVSAMREREMAFWKSRDDRPEGSFVRSGKVGDWQQYFDESLLLEFDAVAGEAMRESGYLP